MTRRVLLLHNPAKPTAAAAVDEVRTLIKTHAVLHADLPVSGAPLPDDAVHANLIVILGGDGTLISQARRCINIGAPIISINAGRLGFLTEFDLPSFRAQVATLLHSPNLPMQHITAMRIETVTRRGNGQSGLATVAINDAVITAGPPFRMIALSLSIDEHPGPTLLGDGLIVSTALGSTAYNLSAGGPIIDPRLEALSITPIAAHSLSFRPVIVPASSRVEIRVERANKDNDHGTTLVLDGQSTASLGAGDRIIITQQKTALRLVRNTDSDYWSRLISKLNWATTPRMNG
jgi:NAD+ kinase